MPLHAVRPCRRSCRKSCRKRVIVEVYRSWSSLQCLLSRAEQRSHDGVAHDPLDNEKLYIAWGTLRAVDLGARLERWLL